MICKECGGEYNDQERYCPYCKSENAKVADELKRKALHNLDKKYYTEKKRLEKEIPTKVVKKGTKIIVLLAGIIFVTLLLGVLIFLIKSVITENTKEVKEEYYLKKLEQCFQDKNYEKMTELLDNTNDSYNLCYRKYEEVSFAYKYYNEWIVREKNEWERYLEQFSGEENIESASYTIYYLLKYSNQLLYETEILCNDNIYRENEEVLKGIQENAIQILQDDFYVTKEEINLLKEKEWTEEEVEAFKDRIVKRYFEKR